MKEYVAPRVPFHIANDKVYSDGDVLFHITGTYLGAILGYSPWESPFTITAKMFGLWDVDVSDHPAVKTGKLLEERIIDYVSMKHPDVGQFFKAEELFAPREGSHDQWKSDFEDEDFAGHVDGIISRDGQDYILEVKTVRDMSSWANGVPPHYLWQVYLYNHFITHQDKAYFAVGMVTSETYKDPYMWVPNKDNCILLEVPIDQEMVAQEIARAREIRRMMAVERCTLPVNMNDPRDTELLTHLLDVSGDIGRLLELASEYEVLMRKIDAMEDTIKDDRRSAEDLKVRIKSMMDAHSLTRCANLTVSEQKRVSVDLVKMNNENPNLFQKVKPYITTTVSKILKRSKK